MIETLTASDARAVCQLWEESDLTRPWNNPERDFVRALDGCASTVLGIREGGQVVATVMVGFDGHRGWVYYLAVRSEFRGRGLGRQLMAGAETWLRRAGAPKIQFMVRSENEGVIEFYTKLGYVPQYVEVLGRRLDQPVGV